MSLSIKCGVLTIVLICFPSGVAPGNCVLMVVDGESASRSFCTFWIAVLLPVPSGPSKMIYGIFGPFDCVVNGRYNTKDLSVLVI